MVGAAQMVAGKNLEDLDDFARDYIVGKEGIWWSKKNWSKKLAAKVVFKIDFLDWVA